ncbi:MAG TPA: hypothetical protein PLY87_30085 [Planctomycetaceae bacterium]|nr:hypothetical protein [Planctomycetaceae bacterium]
MGDRKMFSDQPNPNRTVPHFKVTCEVQSKRDLGILIPERSMRRCRILLSCDDEVIAFDVRCCRLNEVQSSFVTEQYRPPVRRAAEKELPMLCRDAEQPFAIDHVEGCRSETDLPT